MSHERITTSGVSINAANLSATIRAGLARLRNFEINETTGELGDVRIEVDWEPGYAHAAREAIEQACAELLTRVRDPREKADD